MKPFLFLILTLLTVQTTYAQRYRNVKPNWTSNNKIQLKNPKIIKPVLLKPDLVVEQNVQLVTQNGKRYLYTHVKNIGNYRSNANNMELRISWRVDHESFTNVSRIQNYAVKALNPGQVRTFCILVNDDDIHSNEGFGSANASFRFKVDSGQAVNESKEDNNLRYKYVPIIQN